jgi:outer membrane lipoprotein-sorting protein
MCALAPSAGAFARHPPGPQAQQSAGARPDQTPPSSARQAGSCAPPAAAASQPKPPTPTPQPDPLDRVLHSLDGNAAKFRTAQADFVWKTYNSVVGDITETDKGKIYFRRSGSNLQMSARFTEPASKQVIFTGEAVQILQPGGQVDEYDTAAHREELETFLVLGFGSSGQELQKSFEVKELGQEKIGNLQTQKLELTPKAANVRVHVPKILLWIDPARGLSVQQQIFEQSGDYRLSEYSSIELNQKIPDAVFKLNHNVKSIVRH